MPRGTFNRPDPEAMERLLNVHQNDATGIILRLAWREGLTRSEISLLTWDQVDFDEMCLRLPDRQVPLENDTALCLRQRHAEYGELDEFVVITDEFHKPPAIQSISRLVRQALDYAGQTNIRLLDLRGDYLLRQMEEHDWPYALRVSGVSLTTYRTLYAKNREDAHVAEVSDAQDSASIEWKLAQLLREERNSAIGLAIRLTRENQLMAKEIVKLTWDNIDFRTGTLKLDSHEEKLTTDTLNLLKITKQERKEDADPHVILTVKSRKPMDGARLSTIVRNALIRNGISDISLSGFRSKDREKEDNLACIMQYAKKKRLYCAHRCYAIVKNQSERGIWIPDRIGGRWCFD